MRFPALKKKPRNEIILTIIGAVTDVMAIPHAVVVITRATRHIVEVALTRLLHGLPAP